MTTTNAKLNHLKSINIPEDKLHTKPTIHTHIQKPKLFETNQDHFKDQDNILHKVTIGDQLILVDNIEMNKDLKQIIKINLTLFKDKCAAAGAEAVILAKTAIIDLLNVLLAAASVIKQFFVENRDSTLLEAKPVLHLAR